MSARAIHEFRDAYRTTFGEDITEEDACEAAARLLNLIRVIVVGATETVVAVPDQPVENRSIEIKSVVR